MMIYTNDENYSVKNKQKIFCIALSCLVITSCSNRISVSEQEMSTIRKSESQPIDPPPEPYKVEEFIYGAEQLRSPFVAPSLLAIKGRTDSAEGLMPDSNREPEPLEEFNLESLIFHGVVVSPNGEQFGLVQRPDGAVTSVKVGDYIGKNHGRIVEITPTQMNLIELVPSNRSGYVEQAQSLESPIS